MFQLPSSHLQLLLQSQASQFMMCLGAGDFNYQTRNLTNGLYRERKSVAEKLDLRSSPKKFAPLVPAVSSSSNTKPNTCTANPTATSDSLRREQPEVNQTQSNNNAIRNSRKRTMEEIFNSYKLTDKSGPQWTYWRDPRSRLQAYDGFSFLPPSPPEPHAEIYMDIHEERMEGLSYAFEEASMLLST
ncbi:uncharacterized protein LOC128547093 [Mercenaria mercenaria]|uniref:uncharacterized protein LOC128547093 n=1 Tax=Mercenaria mercenaria TaxID=6596 RepID=UPI00234E5F1C|nr:uncharacterized protein LOC128547093 [Mercenaria mercenaria]